MVRGVEAVLVIPKPTYGKGLGESLWEASYRNLNYGRKDRSPAPLINDAPVGYPPRIRATSFVEGYALIAQDAIELRPAAVIRDVRES